MTPYSAESPQSCCAAPAMPVLFTMRAEATELVLLPLNKLLASTPLSRNVLLVSRCPLAQIGWLPNPAFAPVPLGNSAFTPGDRIASPVKLPVGSGTSAICCDLKNVAVRRVDGVHDGRGFHVDRRSDLPDFQRDIQGRGAVRLHQNRGQTFRLKSVVGDGDGVRADR